jgi:tRNA pseudouridine-54 N-methylase
MTNILFKLFDLEIINKQIREENDKFVQNLQGDLEKEQKFKVELHVKHDENNEVLEELKTTRQKINNIEKYNKDLEEIKVERDSLQTTLM